MVAETFWLRININRSLTEGVPKFPPSPIYKTLEVMRKIPGRSKRKKLKSKNLHDLLVSVSSLSVNKQKRELLEHHTSWRDKNEQTDDICLVGFRL